MMKTVKWIQVNLIIQLKSSCNKKNHCWSLSLLEIKSRSLKRKQRSFRPYLYSSSSIKAPEKWVSAGEIDPGLDNTCFITAGDISVDFTSFVSSAMFCFLWTCLSNRVPATSAKGEGWESLACVAGGSANNWQSRERECRSRETNPSS